VEEVCGKEYSTTGARMQEASRPRGLFSNRFVGEWTYILGFAVAVEQPSLAERLGFEYYPSRDQP